MVLFNANFYNCGIYYIDNVSERATHGELKSQVN